LREPPAGASSARRTRWSSQTLLTYGCCVIAVGVAVVWGAVYWFPRDPEAAFQQAFRSLQQGDAGPLLATVRVLKRSPGYGDHLRLLDGMLFLRGQRIEEALRRLFPLPAEGPLRPHFLLYGAQALHAADRLLDAEVLLRELVQREPENAEAHRWLGIVYYDLGGYDAASYALKRLAELEPSDYRPHRLLGLMYFELQLDTEAVLHYEQALQRAPPDNVRHEIIQEMAQSLVSLRRYEEAREIVRGSAPSEMTHLIAAQCAWSRGDAAEARQQLQAARRIGNHESRVDLLEAEILTAEQDLPGAVRVLQAALQRHPRDAELRYRLALTLRDSGLTQEADREFARWREDNHLASELQRLNLEAIKNPHDADVRDQLASLCDQLGKAELAAMWRRAAAACRVPKTAP